MKHIKQKGQIKDNRVKLVFKDCIKSYKTTFLLFFLIYTIFYILFYLYDIEFEAFFYALILGIIILIPFFVISFCIKLRSSKNRSIIKNAILSNENIKNINLKASSLIEDDYFEIIGELFKRLNNLYEDYEKESNNLNEYISTWVHQIKTPISVMKLLLSDSETKLSLELLNELSRIEDYVEMMLHYYRLGSDYNDLVIKEYKLDELIRSCIRKHASSFILKKLYIKYEATEKCIVTDQKWFLCILDQFFSNAIKYTQNGGIEIAVFDDRLDIIDTGIGIAKEDIPCIFEKGYTGVNGRLNQKSSGLGLYLASKAAKKLSLKLGVDSIPNKGTIFSIYFK